MNPLTIFLFGVLMGMIIEGIHKRLQLRKLTKPLEEAQSHLIEAQKEFNIQMQTEIDRKTRESKSDPPYVN